MSDIFNHLDIDFHRIRAVNGAEFSIAELNRLGSDGRRRPGETACFLSHRKCWQHVVDEALPCAAILEDDLHIGNDAHTIFGNGDWIPDGSDIIKIETMNRPIHMDKAPVAIVGKRGLHRLRGTHTGSGGYILTQQGARKLLDLSKSIDHPVDQFIFNTEFPWVRSFTTFQLFPAICIQDLVLEQIAESLGLGSDLHDERTVKPKGLKKAWRELKRPAVQATNFVGRTATRLLTDAHWTTVPFA